MLKKTVAFAGILLFSNIAFAAGTEIQAQADKIVSDVRRSDEQLYSYYEHEKVLGSKKPNNEIKVEKEASQLTEGSVTFMVREIKTSSSRILSEDELRAAINFPEAKSMSITSLQMIVNRINDAYKAKGFGTAQAILPPQTIKDGVVFIRLIEGVVGEVKVEGNKNLPSSYVSKRMKISQNELVDLKKLQRQLDFYNNTNMHGLNAEIIPGGAEESSDIILKVHEPKHRNYNYMWVDNAGQTSTNIYRLGYGFENYGLGHNDDRLNAIVYGSQGVWAGSLNYDTPISHKGLRANIGYSRNRVKIVRGDLKDFDIKSNSNDIYAGLTYPLSVTTNNKLEVFGEIHHKWSDTIYGEIQDLNQERNCTSVKFGLTDRAFDSHGLTYGQLSFTRYISNETQNQEDNDKKGNYFNAFVMRRQNLANKQFLTAKIYGQYSTKKDLPSTETLSIGGMASVRGYKESILSGDKGLYGSLEYNFPISKDAETLRSFVFYDYGFAEDSFSAEGTRKNHLSSCGLGLEFNSNGWYAKVAVGVPLNCSENIKHDKNRIHFYMQKAF